MRPVFPIFVFLSFYTVGLLVFYVRPHINASDLFLMDDRIRKLTALYRHYSTILYLLCMTYVFCYGSDSLLSNGGRRVQFYSLNLFRNASHHNIIILNVPGCSFRRPVSANHNKRGQFTAKLLYTETVLQRHKVADRVAPHISSITAAKAYTAK